MRLSCRVLPGLQDLAGGEVRELTDRTVTTARGRVYLEGTPEDVYRLNLASGCVLRVLVELASTSVESLEDVYEVGRGLPYEDYVPADRAFAVRAKRYGEHRFTSMDVADRVGQAVIDRIRSRRGDRLPVDLDEPEVIVRVMLRGERLTVSLDTTGRSLHRRGYRRNRHPAPLNPTVAHALLRLAGWSGEALLDPFCGAGTIPIEAAGRADGRDPGRFRETFLFENLAFFDESSWPDVKPDAVGSGFDPPWGPLSGSDRSTRYIDFARENARRADVADDVTFRVTRLRDLESLGDARFVVTNPPFGQRSGRPYRMPNLYEAFWSWLGSSSGPVTVAAISGNRDFERAAPGKPTSVCPVMLGDRHCRLVAYRRVGASWTVSPSSPEDG